MYICWSDIEVGKAKRKWKIEATVWKFTFLSHRLFLLLFCLLLWRVIESEGKIGESQMDFYPFILLSFPQMFSIIIYAERTFRIYLSARALAPRSHSFLHSLMYTFLRTQPLYLSNRALNRIFFFFGCEWTKIRMLGTSRMGDIFFYNNYMKVAWLHDFFSRITFKLDASNTTLFDTSSIFNCRIFHIISCIHFHINNVIPFEIIV